MRNSLIGKFTILKVTRLKSSRDGNPRYQLILVDRDNDCFVAKTPVNGSIGYLVSYAMEKTERMISYYYTYNNSMVVTDIR